MASPGPYEKALQLNRGPSVLISSWVMIGLSAAFVIARGAARKKLARLESGDILLPLALIVGFIQTTCIQLAVDNGLGRTYGILGTQASNKYRETMYWAQILYILVLGMTKTTIVLLVIPLGPPMRLVIACYLVGAEVVLSTFAFIFATAFQCNLPSPWEIDGNQCINTSALGRAISITTIVTDIFAVSIPVLAMILYNLNQDSRIFVCGLLSARLLVPTFVGVQLAYLVKYETSQNPTYDAAIVQILTQVVLNVSIITACIPPLGCILSDVALSIVGRKVIPDTIYWGQYSPQGLSRTHIAYVDEVFRPFSATEEAPLCSGAIPADDEKHVVHKQSKNSLSWFKLNSPTQVHIVPKTEPSRPTTKQVHFEDTPPIPATPPSNQYPETEVRSATLDVLSDYTYNLHPGQFNNSTTPPPPVPTTKAPSLHRKLSNALPHKHRASTASSHSTKISEPSFVCASTLVTPPSSGTGYRESLSFERPLRSSDSGIPPALITPYSNTVSQHRLTRSSGSVRPTSSVYSKRESFLRSHRLSKSMSSFPFRQSKVSSAWPGWFERWENKIEEEITPLGSGGFVDVDQEFERCRRKCSQDVLQVREV